MCMYGDTGYDVRAIVRSKERAAELLPNDIELKLGDTCDPAFGEGPSVYTAPKFAQSSHIADKLRTRTVP